MQKNDFESMNFAIFEEVVHNFGNQWKKFGRRSTITSYFPVLMNLAIFVSFSQYRAKGQKF